jgi:isocitrate dehydrogenase kinase/phosphatase
MSDELSTAENFFEEALIDLMTERDMSERGMSIGVQESSSGALSATPPLLKQYHPDRLRKDDLSSEMTLPL